jgi:hypothetical protein
VTPVLEKPYNSVSINPENIIFWHFTNGGHTRKSIMAAPMFLRIKRSILVVWLHSMNLFSHKLPLNHLSCMFMVITVWRVGVCQYELGYISMCGKPGKGRHTVQVTMPKPYIKYKIISSSRSWDICYESFLKLLLYDLKWSNNDKKCAYLIRNNLTLNVTS